MSFLTLLFTCLFFQPFTPAEIPVTTETEIKWYTWDEAYELSKTNPKKVFIDLYTDWCGWCKKMDATTFKEPDVVKYLNDNFYPVKFNAEQKESIVFNNNTFEFVEAGRRGVHQLAYALLDGRLGYPAFVMLDESFARIMISPGFKQSPQLMQELQFAKEEKYKEMSFEDFSRAE
jgi:thioredoxin-related protein